MSTRPNLRKHMHMVRTTDLTWQVLALLRQQDVAYVYLTPEYEVRAAVSFNEALAFRDAAPGGVMYELSCKELP